MYATGSTEAHVFIGGVRYFGEQAPAIARIFTLGWDTTWKLEADSERGRVLHLVLHNSITSPLLNSLASQQAFRCQGDAGERALHPGEYGKDNMPFSCWGKSQGRPDWKLE